MKHKEGRLVTLLIGIFLSVFDVGSDWALWFEWRNKNQNNDTLAFIHVQYVFLYFLIAATSAGLLVIELILFGFKLKKLHKNWNKTPVRKLDEPEPEVQKYYPKFTAVVRILTASLEDLPVAMLAYNLANQPEVENEAKDSWVAMLSLALSLVNSIWTFSELQTNIFQRTYACKNRQCWPERVCNCGLLVLFFGLIILLVYLRYKLVGHWVIVYFLVGLHYCLVSIYLMVRGWCQIKYQPDPSSCPCFVEVFSSVSISVFGWIVFPTICVFTTFTLLIIVFLK